ncbi:MAG: 2-hydroxyacid dehydrogenase [Dehalococcoidia bacterium]
MRPHIFVVQPVFDEALEPLRAVGEVELFPHTDRRISKEELLAGVRRSQYLFTLGEIVIDAEVIRANPGLKLIATMAIYPTTVDIAAATAQGIPVTCIPNFITETTADITFALLLGVAWRLPEADRFTRNGQWRQNQSMAFLCSHVYGKTLGIVGLGKVGQGVARRAGGFDMRVLYTKRTRLSPEEEAELGVEWRELEKLFREADYVSLTPTLTASSEGLVGERLLSLMKPTAILINTSRGRVLDEEALVRALQEGRIAGAGLDVYQWEPPLSDPSPHPALLRLPNVVLTPHIGSATPDTRIQMAERVVQNILAVMHSQRPPDVVNPEVYGEGSLTPTERIG